MMTDVSIVAGGWSVRDVDPNRLVGYVIGVNESAILLPRIDAIVSMDRMWTEHRWSQLQRLRREAWLRRSAIQNIKPSELRIAASWLRIFECDHEANVPTDDPKRLNGTNSGACAINLAYRLRPRRVFLLGFDMSRSPDGQAYWYPSYTWAKPQGGTGNKRYAEWATQFEEIAAAFRAIGTQVFNVSPNSAIKSFTKITPKEYEEEFHA